MAYLDLDCGAFPTSTSSVPRVRDTEDWALHRQVLELSLRDGPASLCTPTRLQRMVAAIFGTSSGTRLADTRLEALRRFAVLYRLGDVGLQDVEAMRMRDAGFTDEAISRFSHHLDLAAHGRRDDRHRLGHALFVVTMLGLAAAFAAWLCNELDDPLIAAVLAGVIVVTLAPLLGGQIKQQPTSMKENKHVRG
jgi:hypothetical protein